MPTEPHNARCGILGLALMVLCARPALAQISTPDGHQPAAGSLKGQLFGIVNAGGGSLELDPAWIFPLTTVVGLEASTAPLGSSSGGFTFAFDPILGAPARSSQTFGPAFAERALTVGHARISLGFNALFNSYDRLAGQDLHNLKVFELVPVLNSTIEQSVTLSLRSKATAIFGRIGVTDRVEVGFLVPILSVSVGGQISETFTPSSTHNATLQIPSVTRSGVGDIGLSAKAVLWRHRHGGFAGSVDVRLPTGDPDNFMGLGITRATIWGIWSRGGKISPHANFGYEFWSSPVVTGYSTHVLPGVTNQYGGPVFGPPPSAKDRIRYTTGLEIEAGRARTIVVDFVGETIRHGGAIGNTHQTPQTYSDYELGGLYQGLSSLSLAPGFKWNLWRTMLLTGHVLVQIHNDGMHSRPVPVIGFEWAR